MAPETPRPPDRQHERPHGVDDATVAAAGKSSEALEWIERARGRLFDFHQMVGHADLLLDEAASGLDEAGHPTLADQLRTELIGRDVLSGRWTFQVVEELDEGYYRELVAIDRSVRDELMDGRRHVFEAELKERRRTPGRPGRGQPTAACSTSACSTDRGSSSCTRSAAVSSAASRGRAAPSPAPGGAPRPPRRRPR